MEKVADPLRGFGAEHVGLAGRPVLLSDWLRAVFIHYEVEPGVLAQYVPFELDVRGGRAYVSLVAFTIDRLRPAFGGRIAEALLSPIATHGFFNVRTYVRHRGEPGIYFIREWLSNHLSVLLGPPTFGLPYRYGRIRYDHDHETGRLNGCVAAGCNRIRYHAALDSSDRYRPCASDSVDAFLPERYVAFTEHGRTRRLFRIKHEPWPQVRAELVVEDDALLRAAFAWFPGARFVGANYSPGVRNVQIGPPESVGARS